MESQNKYIVSRVLPVQRISKTAVLVLVFKQIQMIWRCAQTAHWHPPHQDPRAVSLQLLWLVWLDDSYCTTVTVFKKKKHFKTSLQLNLTQSKGDSDTALQKICCILTINLSRSGSTVERWLLLLLLQSQLSVQRCWRSAPWVQVPFLGSEPKSWLFCVEMLT